MAGGSVLVLTPLSQSPVAVTAGSNGKNGWPDTTVRVGLAGRGSSFFIRSIGRVGHRMDENGHIHGVMDDLPGTASLAVVELLLAAIAPGTSEAEARAAMEAAHRKADEVGRRIYEPEIWTIRRMVVDGIGFVLRIRVLPQGFAAVADLGNYLVTMHGDRVPDDLSFTLRKRADIG